MVRFNICTDGRYIYGYDIFIVIPEVNKNTEYKIFIPLKDGINIENLNDAYFGKIVFGVVEPAHAKIIFKAYNPEQVAEYIKNNIINKPVTVSNDNSFYPQTAIDSEQV